MKTVHKQKLLKYVVFWLEPGNPNILILHKWFDDFHEAAEFMYKKRESGFKEASMYSKNPG